MADLKKVIEKLSLQRAEDEKKSKPGKPTPLPQKPMKKEVIMAEEEDDEEEEEEPEEEVEEEEEEEVRPVKKVKTKEPVQVPEVDAEKQMLIEIERLQNNGVFRAELLFQLITLNENLKIITSFVQKSGGEDDE